MQLSFAGKVIFKIVCMDFSVFKNNLKKELVGVP